MHCYPSALGPEKSFKELAGNSQVTVHEGVRVVGKRVLYKQLKEKGSKGRKSSTHA